MDIRQLPSGILSVSEREEKSLGLLQSLLQLTPRNAPLSLTGDDSVVFVAIDFEFFPSKAMPITDRLNEIGISTFDTRDLSGAGLQGSIRSQYHIYRSFKHTWRKFLFDESKRIVPKDMRMLLEDNIFVKDANGKARRTVLVGHGLHGAELELMESLGIDLVDTRSSSGFLGVLDTLDLGMNSQHLCLFRGSSTNDLDLGSAVLGDGPRGSHFSLADLLSRLNIPFAYLHYAGNDAHFTLKALFALAVHSMEGASTKLNQEQQEILTKLRAVGYASIAKELEGRTPDQELYHQDLLSKVDEKRASRLKAKEADVLDHFPSFVELEICD